MPMKINLGDSKKPAKVKVHSYAADQQQFPSAYFNELVKVIFLKVCTAPSWQAAPHLVLNDAERKYHTTIDLWSVNAATEAEQWPMPFCIVIVNSWGSAEWIQRSSHSSYLDFSLSHWQFPLDPQFYDACGILAPLSTFVSTRALQWVKNALAYFQSTIPTFFKEIKNAIKADIDDFTIYAKRKPPLYEYLETLFKISRAYNLYLSAKHSALYTNKVECCCRNINGEGYRMDSRNIKAIRIVKYPINAPELCQFMHCSRWMSTSITDLHKRMQLLDNVLEKAYGMARKRKKSLPKSIPHHKLSLGMEHKQALASIQDSLRNALEMTFFNPKKVVCAYTNASKALLAAIVTLTNGEHLKIPTVQRQHEPLAFLGGKCNGSPWSWSTYEKEAYAAVRSFEKLDYLFWEWSHTHVFPDYGNLLYFFSPLALRPNSPRNVLSKLQRWAIHLSRFELYIKYIERAPNVFADILTRRSKNFRVTGAKANMIAAIYNEMIPSSTDTPVVLLTAKKTEQ